MVLGTYVPASCQRQLTMAVDISSPEAFWSLPRGDNKKIKAQEGFESWLRDRISIGELIWLLRCLYLGAVTKPPPAMNEHVKSAKLGVYVRAQPHEIFIFVFSITTSSTRRNRNPDWNNWSV